MLLKLYRSLPWFKGKLRLGKFIFASAINKSKSESFIGHGNIKYSIPNTKENLGIELMINGIYEQEIVTFLQNKIPENAVYFDIGANIGSLGLPVLTMKENISYHGFEASPMVFDYLKKNLEANKIDGYKIVNKLVHKDMYQEMKFYQTELYGKSSLAPTYSNDFIMMGSLSIDEYCRENKIERIDWMKVDVQGFEIFVFEGMEKLLNDKRVHNILFEYEPWAEEQANVKIGIAKDFIGARGFDLLTLDGLPWDSNHDLNDTMIWARRKV